MGSGYEFGYYDEDREFVYLDETDETTITMRASGSGNGVTVTETKSGDVLYRFSDNGYCFGVRPIGRHTETWCKGYKYAGGFEYRCNSNGTLTVINVVDLEDYVKGVLPYEMDKDWPLAALEAQAVCARYLPPPRPGIHLWALTFAPARTVRCTTAATGQPS